MEVTKVSFDSDVCNDGCIGYARNRPATARTAIAATRTSWSVAVVWACGTAAAQLHVLEQIQEALVYLLKQLKLLLAQPFELLVQPFELPA